MILTLLIAFLSLIALMIIHEFGHFIIAKKFGVRVEEFGIGYPPRIFGKQFGDTFYSVNMVPLGAFVKIYGEEGGVDDYRSFSNLAIWKRILICLGGVIAFWVASIIIFSVVFLIGASVPVGDQDIEGAPAKISISAVSENSPAQAAGLRRDDEIVGLAKIADFQKLTSENKGKEIPLTILRDGKEMIVLLTPRLEAPAGQGLTGLILERTATIIEKTSWYEAPIKGTMLCWDITVKSVQGIGAIFVDVFSGKGVPQGAELAGPVGITIFLANAANYGAGFFLYFIGSLSVFIALFNLFPIPALDGGKLLFLIIEKVMGKPVPVKWEQGITILFFILLISMSLFVTVWFDIPRVMNYWKAGI